MNYSQIVFWLVNFENHWQNMNAKKFEEVIDKILHLENNEAFRHDCLPIANVRNYSGSPCLNQR